MAVDANVDAGEATAGFTGEVEITGAFIEDTAAIIASKERGVFLADGSAGFTDSFVGEEEASFFKTFSPSFFSTVTGGGALLGDFSAFLFFKIEGVDGEDKDNTASFGGDEAAGITAGDFIATTFPSYEIDAAIFLEGESGFTGSLSFTVGGGGGVDLTAVFNPALRFLIGGEDNGSNSGVVDIAVAEGAAADFWGDVGITCVSISEVSISEVSSLSFVLFSTAFFGVLSTLRFFTGGDDAVEVSSEVGVEKAAAISSVSVSAVLGVEVDGVPVDFLEIGVAIMSSAKRFGFACRPLLLTESAAEVDGVVDAAGVLLSVSDGPELIESRFDAMGLAAFLAGVLAP